MSGPWPNRIAVDVVEGRVDTTRRVPLVMTTTAGGVKCTVPLFRPLWLPVLEKVADGMFRL